MKVLSGILVAIAITVVCRDAAAETPQIAYGVTIVGSGSPCAESAGLRCTDLSAHPYVLVGGFSNPGDDGGGYFALGPAGCTDNGGTILKDLVGDCFYRTDARAAIPVQWFGAKCDGITTVYGGTTTDLDHFQGSGVTFQTGDVGKVIELNAAGTGGVPFRTTITAVNTSTNTVTLNTAAPVAYPGAAGVKSAKFLPVLQQGLDNPGSGYLPQDVLTINELATTQAQVRVRATSLVNFNQTSGGSTYRINDLIYFAASDTTDYNTVEKAVIQVTEINMGGGVTDYAWIDYGKFRAKSDGATNPSAFTITTSGHGTGYAISLLPSNGSFGVGSLYPTPVAVGAYTTPPPFPSATTDNTTPAASGATVDLALATPTWVYGTEDTSALTKLETWMETDYDRGIFNAAEVPGDHTCLLQTLQINRPVTWRSSGSRQAQLLQLMGSAGSTIDGTRYGFVLVAANLPSADTYQDTTVGQQAIGLNNISIAGGTTALSVDVDGTTTAYTNDGLLFQNPTGKANSNVNAAMENLQVVNFPGNALSALHFSGEFRGYNVYAGGSGGNCVDLEYTANPYRFYGLVASSCPTGINLVQTKSEEFHGASVFGNNINVSVTGTEGSPEAYILFDGLQLGGAQNEHMYLDQQNETVICAANCSFKDAGEAGNSGDGDAAIVIGPDATTSAGGPTPTVLVLDQGNFSESVDNDIRFDTANGNPCSCTVSLGASMLDITAANGIPTTNNPALMLGQTGYAPPTFANAASVGVPLTLNPNELGMGVSTDTEAGPGTGGLKFRVECSTQSGKVKLVVLAGNSGTETVLADGIGGGVGGSCGN